MKLAGMKLARLFVIAALFTTTAAAATPPNDAAIHDLARAWLADNDGVGLSIGIYANGQRRFFNVGTTQLDGNALPTKETIYDIGAVGKTMTGQLLARAVVEGRASLDDDVAKYLGAPYQNLEYEKQRIQLKHLANMTSQLADNIPDITQVRRFRASRSRSRECACSASIRAKEFLRQLHRVAPRRQPGERPGARTSAACCWASCWRRLYGEPFDVILAREIEKPLRMASGTQPNAKLLAKGYTRKQRTVAAVRRADGIRRGLSALQHRRPAALRVLAAG